MSVYEIVLIGIALSMDAFAVCIASSMVYTNMTRAKKLSMPVAFGLFQGIMRLRDFISEVCLRLLLKNGRDRFLLLYSVL